MKNMTKIDEGYGEKIFESFSNIKFAKYINCLDNSFFERKIDIFKFIRDYKFNTNISNFYENPILFNKYIIDPQKRNYKLNDINKYEEKREEYFITAINKNNDNNIIKKIIYSYFNYDYTKYKELLYKINNMNIKINNKELFNYITNIENYDSKELINYIKFIKEYPNYFKLLENKIKKESLIDIINKLTRIKKNQDIIVFDGQSFILLVHKISGLLDQEKSDEFNKDISNWNKYYEKNSYISCSLINELGIALTGGNYLTIGFSNIKSNDILAMNITDMHYTSQDIILNDNDKVSNYMTADMLIANSKSYNEVVINRYREKNAVMPDYVLSFDKINDKEKNASEKLNVPIYLIKLESYANIMINKLQKLKINNDPKYLKLIEKFCNQLNFDNKDLIDYYNKIIKSEALKSNSEDVNKLILKMNGKMKKS